MKHTSEATIRALAAAVQADMPEAPQQEPFGLGAPWTHYATTEEFERLARLHSRILRKEKALASMRDERAAIMRRSIRRMRRATGKV
ncbi:hypothetical protein [Pseudophaeobacter flagellatus]|uniref:hypothetical protein n=1 Tax=Pseudophaeobacter flagellatus TaxID=2899119 RepID=UPI001E3F5D11|nr:hypothetical protein [Pseudophaeobacter flagellatus]MCD9149015.1 hypothetical protein [Pseudophaeobacter flagellatus]